jgi:hypothetical protein
MSRSKSILGGTEYALKDADSTTFRFIPIQDSLFRVNLKTGETWLLSNKEFKWKLVPEDE